MVENVLIFQLDPVSKPMKISYLTMEQIDSIEASNGKVLKAPTRFRKALPSEAH